MRIGIDPGHGGRDPGAIGPGGTQEKDVALAISLRVDKCLRQAGVTTFLTRTTDVALASTVNDDLRARTNALNAAGADIAVSIHCDSLTPTANHFGVYVYGLGGEAEKLAHKVIRRVQETTGWSWGADDDGIREKSLHMVRETKMPAILIECNFISNPSRESELKASAFQEKLARAIAAGVLDYCGLKGDDKDMKIGMEIPEAKVTMEGKTAEKSVILNVDGRDTTYIPAVVLRDHGYVVNWDAATSRVTIKKG